MPRFPRGVSAMMLAAVGAMVGCREQSHEPPEQQQPTGYSFAQGFPGGDAARRAYADKDFSRAVVAYHFWYPTVSAEGIFQGNRDAGIEDNAGGAILSAGPRQVAFTANSDTPYAAAVLDVSQGPMVIEVPAGPYIGLVDDHNQSWVLDLGIPGPNAGKGDKVVIVPSGYSGKVPKGYAVGKSETYKLLLAVRALPVNGDQKGAIEALKNIKVYPVNAKDRLMTWTDVMDRKMDASCLRWEDNMQFWQVLKKIVDEEPVSIRTPGMSGMLAAIGIVKGQPFNPSPRMSEILLRAAMTSRDQMLVSAFASNRADRLAWQGRRWQWVGLVPGGGAV